MATTTWPDLAYTVRELARFMSNYGQTHWGAAKHLLRYLQGTRSLGITLGNIDDAYPLFRGFTDSDWASSDSRRFISGYIMLLGESPIAWSLKQQGVVALSSCEAEYIVCSHATAKIMWLRNLFDELGFPQEHATKLYYDNNGTIASTHDPHSHSHMKHIDIRHHYIRNCVNKGHIVVLHVSRTENRADMFTKALSRVLHDKGLAGLRMHWVQGGVL